MKIEIGEMLCLSYLRHIGCSVVQLNWKMSPNTESSSEVEVIRAQFTKLQKLAKQRSKTPAKELAEAIIKQTASFEQWLKQAEIDAIGLEIRDGKVQRAVAVDVAFHESGLNYGGKEESAARVAKKMLRTTFVLEAAFQPKKADVIFATPKVSDATAIAVRGALDLLQTPEVDFRPAAYQWRWLAGKDFYDQMVAPLVANLHDTESASDTSELFVRSMQLLRIGDYLKAD